jgi:hypothetical protein
VASRAPRPTILLDLFVAFQRSAQAVELAFAEEGLDVPAYAILSTVGVEGPVTATALARRAATARSWSSTTSGTTRPRRAASSGADPAPASPPCRTGAPSR